MMKDILNAITNAVRKLFANFGTTILAIILFALLALVVWAFFYVGVATVTEVVLSLVILPLGGAILFFTLQALGLSSIRIGVGPGYLLRRALVDCWKLFLVSVPLLLLWWLCSWGLGKLEGQLSYAESDEWKRTALDWACFVILWLALPLMAIHVWLAAVREGLAATLKGFLRHCLRAFAPRSLAVFVILALVFGLLVRLLLYTKTQFGGTTVEFALFNLRFGLALLLGFLGWYVTLGALAEVTAPPVESREGE